MRPGWAAIMRDAGLLGSSLGYSSTAEARAGASGGGGGGGQERGGQALMEVASDRGNAQLNMVRGHFEGHFS